MSKINMLLGVVFVFCSATCYGQSGKGKILVVNKGSHSVSILDPVKQQLIKMVPVGNAPHELAVDPQNPVAYVANYGLPGYGNSISVIDTRNGTEIKRINTGALYRPHCIKFQQGVLYFTSEATRSIARYNLAKDSVDWLAGTGQDGGHMLVLTADGKKVFVANRVSNTVSVITIDKNNWPGGLIHINTGSKPEAIDISPGGKEVWVGNAGDGSIDIIDAHSLTITHRLQAGKTPIRLQFTPDGKKVLVSDSGTDSLIVIDAGTKSIIKKLSCPGAPMGILIQPDNQKAYIACSNAGLVRIFDLPSLTFTSTIQTGEAPDGIGWIQLP